MGHMYVVVPIEDVIAYGNPAVRGTRQRWSARQGRHPSVSGAVITELPHTWPVGSPVFEMSDKRTLMIALLIREPNVPVGVGGHNGATTAADIPSKALFLAELVVRIENTVVDRHILLSLSAIRHPDVSRLANRDRAPNDALLVIGNRDRVFTPFAFLVRAQPHLVREARLVQVPEILPLLLVAHLLDPA